MLDMVAKNMVIKIIFSYILDFECTYDKRLIGYLLT